MRLDDLRRITATASWRVVADTVVIDQGSLAFSPEDFSVYWIEAGHRIREQVSDDRLLCKLLRYLLPRYSGGSVTLYRGENRGRWQARQVGFSWTQDIEVARMFARGRNATRTGGVLLGALFSPEVIITGPSAHSVYLGEGEYTIDPFLAPELNVLEEYAPV
jgi:hypothetical protein